MRNSRGMSEVAVSIGGQELAPSQVNVIRLAMQEFAERYRRDDALGTTESAKSRTQVFREEAGELFLMLYP